ncbi:hypothetical protein H257_18250 [Aphanomyces astaci]|uniref:ISXO2-like transposase domain-containing protein n=1 Tax=Aphanomyces astaci TaxID=112090 RepID=W4FDI7_APHAT|nr:hypothetical protein H257_18250 [Aphanomyces astaci]ETV64954.1 hypothetical protein H257_18250 [Aphanomyces astaci]|eukprot:XP_009845578.1 hypothetical protein H257_18250 [Aphanomyces astaci]
MDEDTCVAWCMKVGHLPNAATCPKCDLAMSFAFKSKPWRCRRAACTGGGSVERGMRFASWFKGSKIPMAKLVRLIFAWASRKPVGIVIAEEEIARESGVDWYQYCHDLCSAEMLCAPMLVGGEGVTVEIDETSMKKKRKYNRGRYYPEHWVFGGVDRTTKKWFGVITGADRTKPTLSRLIKKHIAPGTNIILDKFGSYVSANERHNLTNNPLLVDQSYGHQWVNHSANFVNPANGAHTQ